MSFISTASRFSLKTFAKEELRYIGQILFCTLFLSLSGQFCIPYYPIPATLQTLCIMGLSLYFKPQAFFMGSIFWLSLGIIGLPVFAGFQGGLLILLGVRGGYILSMIFGGTLLAWANQELKKTDFSLAKRTCGVFLLFLCFSLVVLACGATVYGFLLGNYHQGFLLGAAPFFMAEIFKASLGACLSVFSKKK